MFLFLGLRENNAARPSIYLCCLQKVTRQPQIKQALRPAVTPSDAPRSLVSTQAAAQGMEQGELWPSPGRAAAPTRAIEQPRPFSGSITMDIPGCLRKSFPDGASEEAFCQSDGLLHWGFDI